MTWMHCRSGCGAHRSCTVVSAAGEHIPECFVCHDPSYIDSSIWGYQHKLACKDIPDATFLTAVNTAAMLRDAGWASIWDVQYVLSSLPGFVGTTQFDISQTQLLPWLLVRAKARKLIRRGLMDGCYCGCRGDFVVEPGVETVGVVARDGSIRRVVMADAVQSYVRGDQA